MKFHFFRLFFYIPVNSTLIGQGWRTSSGWPFVIRLKAFAGTPEMANHYQHIYYPRQVWRFMPVPLKVCRLTAQDPLWTHTQYSNSIYVCLCVCVNVLYARILKQNCFNILAYILVNFLKMYKRLIKLFITPKIIILSTK